MFTTILALTGMFTGLGALALGGYTLSRTRAVSSESQVLADRAAAVSALGVDSLAVRDVAVLHYDALEEMSGARSFSLALLNSEGDGVVVTSINGRTESRTYAKPVVRGDSQILLSPEEDRVIRSARLGDGVGGAAAVPAVADAVTADPASTGSAPSDAGTGGTHGKSPEGADAPDAHAPDAPDTGDARAEQETDEALVTVLQGAGDSGHGGNGGNGDPRNPVSGAPEADVPGVGAQARSSVREDTGNGDARAPEPRSGT